MIGPASSPRPRARHLTTIGGALVILLLTLSRPLLGWTADIAVLKSSEAGYYTQAIQAFRATLPPATTVTEYALGGDLARGRDLAQALRAAPPDLVLAVGLKAALAAKLELVETPTLFCLVLDPEAYGLPAPNMTGIAMRVSPDAQLAAIRTLAPRAKRIGLLYDPDQTGPLVAEAQRAARKLGLELLTVSVPDAAAVPPALRAMLPKLDLLWLLQDPTIVTHEALDFLLRTTLEAKVPVFGFSPTLVQQGALGALVVPARDIGRQAGSLATELLRGKGPGRPALHEPPAPQLAVNLNTADYVGLSPSKEVLRLAARLYGGPGPLAQLDGDLPPLP